MQPIVHAQDISNEVKKMDSTLTVAVMVLVVAALLGVQVFAQFASMM